MRRLRLHKPRGPGDGKPGGGGPGVCPLHVAGLDAVPALLHAVLAPLQLVVDLLRYHSERFLHVDAQLSRGLKEGNLVVIRKVLENIESFSSNVVIITKYNTWPISVVTSR